MTQPVIIVTGGGRGIGAAACLRAAADGYAVVVNYLKNESRALAVVDSIQKGGGNAIAVQADVAIESEVERLFGVVDEQFGTVNALVNNAGIVAPQMRLVDMTADRIRRMLDVNVVGAMLCSREAVRRMATDSGRSGGVIINLSSAAARIGAANEYIDYAASKAAVETLTIGLANEVARCGIRVVGIRPGIIDTEIHASGGVPDRAEKAAAHIPLGRAGTVDDIAQAIAWLLSDDASYVTGTILDVTGGR